MITIAAHTIYQFHAELLDYKPKIWRRFQVTNNFTMARLGYILMAMFEMQAKHLFCFDIPANANFKRHFKDVLSEKSSEKDFNYYFPTVYKDKNWHFELLFDKAVDYDPDDDEQVFEASKSIIKNAISLPNSIMYFTYDYGDNWKIRITLEKVFTDPNLPGRNLPRLINGEGYGIIEDCGGTDALKLIANAFKEKKGPEYEEYCKWIGRKDLDMRCFDMDDLNFRLKKIPRIYADIYERNISPSRDSINLLNRKYKRK